MQKAQDEAILIADSGSTKTDWLFAREGSSLYRFQTPGVNPFYQSSEEIAEVFRTDLAPQLPGVPARIFFYGAGCADDKTGKVVSDALATVAPDAEAEIASDMLGAARALCLREQGIACILGTGANNAVFDGVGIVKSIGSLGFWLGDEGSGSFFGKTLVVHYLQRELPAELQEAFEQEFTKLDRLVVLENAYRKPYPNRYFASFSGFIFKHKEHPFLRNMLEAGFRSFAEKYIVRHHESSRLPVHFAGSVAYYYRDILTDVLKELDLRSGRIVKSPLEGLMEYHLK